MPAPRLELLRERRPPARGVGHPLGWAAAATAAAALWLGVTVATVLRTRDPRHVPLWGGVALGMLAYAAVSALAVRPGRAQRACARSAGLLGVPAIGLGAGAATRMLAAGRSGAHFEGYVVILGAIVTVHGLVALMNVYSPPDGGGGGPAA